MFWRKKVFRNALFNILSDLVPAIIAGLVVAVVAYCWGYLWLGAKDFCGSYTLTVGILTVITMLVIDSRSFRSMLIEGEIFYFYLVLVLSGFGYLALVMPAIALF